MTVPPSPARTPAQREVDYLAYVHLTGRWPTHLRAASNARVRRCLEDGSADGETVPLRLRADAVEEFELTSHPMVRTATDLKGYGYRVARTDGPNARRCFDRFRMTRAGHDLHVFVNGAIWTDDLSMFQPHHGMLAPPPQIPPVRHRERPGPRPSAGDLAAA
jgi:hypothetical protein